ncbi:MAG: hypothetical protein KC417_00150, partial [Myxococcales bacterium]|nr:hypothetical protein [Myxococcales bacterium]
MAPSPAPNSLFPRIGEPDDFSVARIQWLIRLRWIAIAGITVTTALAWLGAFPGVEWRVTGAAGVVAFAYNFVLWRSTSAGGACGHRAGVFQAVVDMLLLTVVLWSAGGVSNPFTAFYVFHVALVGVLGGPSATLKALGMAILCVAALALTHFVPALQIGTWAPLPPWGFITTNFAFVTTVGAIAYLTTHAMRELRAREAALVEARAREALEYQLLVKTLNELDAGLEVVADDGTVLWQNKRAEALAPALERASADNKGPEVEDENGVRRRTFAVASENHEYLYEQIAFPLSADDDARTMNLYVDRTQAMLQEGRLVLAERLVTLGRMAQGVAHEL